MRRFFARLASLFTGSRAERELSREIESHLGLMQADFEARGLSPDEARRAARLAYGGVEQAKEVHREARSVQWVENLAKDMRYGARNLFRTPGFTVVAVLTLALGIGANTAIFGVVNAVLLRPLAYKDAGRLVTLLHEGTNPVAAANYFDWRDQTRSFAGMGAADAWSANLTSSDAGDLHGAENLRGLKVTQSLFPLLGVEPLLGRLFAAGEDQPGSDHQVILSHSLWRRRFGSDTEVLGRQVVLNGQPYTVVGVMPAGFQFAPFWATRSELWVPNSLAASRSDRAANHLRVFARLKDGVSLQQARAEMGAVTGRLERQYPTTNRSVAVTPLKENVVGKVEAPLLMMLGAVGFVLLIACANVAHMLLARTADRQKEIALRVALGAGKARVVAQFLTENVLLAGLGAGVGLLLAYAGTRALVKLSPEYIPRVEMVGIDGNVVLFLVGITGLTALAFGLVPAMRAAGAKAGANLAAALKQGGRGDTEGGRNRLRNFLVASEFALAFMLLIGAGLMVRSFVALRSVEPGFNPKGVLSMVVSVAGTKEAQPGRRAVLYPELLKKVRQLPGVMAVGGINHLPLAGDMWGLGFEIEGRAASRPGEGPRAVYRIALPGYFETMRLPVLSGRVMTERDDGRVPAVAVINERAARRYWPGESPLGKRITLGGPGEWVTVVGVVANAKQADWAAEPEPEVYLAGLQTLEFLGDGKGAAGAHMNYVTLVVRTAGNPADMTAAVRRSVQEFDRNLSVSQVLTMEQAVADATAQPRFEMLLLALAGGVALILAAVGIYGVMNYAVVRRTREIGIRISLGASCGDVLGMVFRRALLQALAGTAVGIAGAVLLSKFMAKMVFGVRPTDPWTFAAVTVLLAVAAVAASGIPARRASRIQPMQALRSE
jgi:putative ABC transport system permease protein